MTALFAVWLAAELLGGSRARHCLATVAAPLALVLAALVNIKQSGIGLLVPIGVTMLVLARADPAITAPPRAARDRGRAGPPRWRSICCGAPLR